MTRPVGLLGLCGLPLLEPFQPYPDRLPGFCRSFRRSLPGGRALDDLYLLGCLFQLPTVYHLPQGGDPLVQLRLILRLPPLAHAGDQGLRRPLQFGDAAMITEKGQQIAVQIVHALLYERQKGCLKIMVAASFWA